MIEIDERNNGQTFDFSAGDFFRLCLPENRTTGYRWAFESDGSPCCTLLDDRTLPGPRRPGAPGTRCWTFRAVTRGACRLILRSRRPWGAQGGGQAFTVDVRVGP